MFVTPNNWDQVNSTAMGGSAGGSWVHITKANGTGFRYFRFFSSTSGGTVYEPNGGSDLPVTLTTPTNLQVRGSGKAYYIDAPNTGDDWVFKTIGSGTPGSSRLLVFRVQGNVQSVASSANVTRSPSGAVYPGQAVTISATATAALPTGQGLYLRYTTDNFATSTIVPMVFSTGSTYTASIPGSANAASNNLRYYVFTSGSGLTIAPADADFYTINLQNNGGFNFSYNVESAWETNQTGNWNTGATWKGGAVPLDNQPIRLLHNVSLDIASRVATRLIINDGISLDLNSHDLTVTATTGNAVTGGTTTAAIINSTAGGALVTSASGTVTFTGRLNITNVRLAAATNFGSNSTIVTGGSVFIVPGGSVVTNAPIYASGSAITYNLGTSFTRGTEWTTTAVPHNVLVTTGTTLHLGGGSATITANGTLTVQSGATVSMGSRSGFMQVNALSLAGTLVQSTDASSWIQIMGDAAFTTGCTYTDNSRFLVFSGNTPASVTGTPPALPRITVSKNTGSLTLSVPTTISAYLELSSGTLAAGSNLTISNSSTIARSGGTITGNPNWGTNLTATYLNTFNGTTSTELPPDANLSILNVNIGSTVSLGRAIVLATGAVTNVSGTLNLSSLAITGAGTLNMNSTGNLTISNASGISAVVGCTVSSTLGSQLQLNTSGNLGPVAGFNNTRVVVSSGVAITHNTANFSCAGLQLNANASWNAGVRQLTLSNNGPVTSLNLGTGATFTAGTGRVTFAGSGVHTVNQNVAFHEVVLQNVGLNLSAGGSIAQRLEMQSGSFISSTSPTYLSGSTLAYNIAGPYGRGNEWNATSGPGYPHHVQIVQGTVTLDGVAGPARALAGDLDIQAGATLSMGAMNQSLTVNGSVVCAGGLTLGSAIGGDLHVVQNINFNTGSTLTHNNREVVMVGTGPQTITGTMAILPTVPYLAHQGSGVVSVAKPMSISLRLRLSTTGSLDPAGNLTMADNAEIMRERGTVTTLPALAGNVVIRYANQLDLTPSNEVPADQSKIASIIVEAGSFTLSLDRDFSLSSGRNFTLTNGTLLTGGFSIGGAGTFIQNGGTLRVTHASGVAGAVATTTRTFNNGTITFASGTAQSFGAVSGLNNMFVRTEVAGTTVTLNGPATIRNLNIGTGTTFNGGANTLTVTIPASATSMTNNGTFQHGNGKIVFVSSGGNNHNMAGAWTLYDVDLNPSGLGGMDFGLGGVAVAGKLSLFPGSYVFNNATTFTTGGTLCYRTGGTYNISIEWTAPHNVEVANNTLLNLGGSIPSVPRTLAGNLIVEAGSAASINEPSARMTAPLNVGGSIICAGGLYLSENFGGDLNLGGDLILNTGASFVANRRAITFNGSSDQLFGGTQTGPLQVQFITVNKPGGTLTCERDLEFNNGSDLVRFWQENGHTNLNGIALTTFGSGTKTFRVDNGTLTTGGTPLTGMGWTFQDNVGTGRLGGTVVFNKTGDEQVLPVRYQSLTFEGSGNRELLANLDIDKRLTWGGSTTITGAFTIAYGAGATLVYQGTAQQDLGIEWPTTSAPANVVIDNQVVLNLTASRTVPDTLRLLKGDIFTGSNTLSLGTSTASPGVLINNSLGAIRGAFRRWVPATAASYELPVGIVQTQRKAVVDFTSAPSTGGTLTASYFEGRPVETGLPFIEDGILINNLGANGIWSVVTGDGLAGGTYSIELHGRDFLGVNDFSRLRVVKRPSILFPWELVGTGVAPTGDNNSPIVGRAGLTSFSEFAIAGQYTENPLPVDLLSFSASAQDGGQDLLQWSTATERNASHFILSSSTDGTTYKPVANVKAAGNSAQRRDYSQLVHAASLARKGSGSATRYYRLQQYDLDGSLGGTWFASVSGGGNRVIKLWPQPVRSDVNIVLDGLDGEPLQVVVQDALGRVVSQRQFTAVNGDARKNLEQLVLNLSPGTYMLRLSTAVETLAPVRVVKQ